MLGYMLVWQRGMYMDDYFFQRRFETKVNEQSFPELLAGYYRFPTRFFSRNVALFSSGWLPTHERRVRLISALANGVNALLLGWLTYRLLASRAAGVISGWLYLMPFFSRKLCCGPVPVDESWEPAWRC